MMILYFIDETENIKLQKEYKDSKSCVAILMVDNYEEMMQKLESEQRPQVIAKIDKCIYEWTDQANGVLIKTERDKYVYLFEQRYLEKLKEEKFSILDKIKEVSPDENTQFTLSIAVSNEGLTDKEKYRTAQSAMDIVLGRGGDQVVVKTAEQIEKERQEQEAWAEENLNQLDWTRWDKYWDRDACKALLMQDFSKLSEDEMYRVTMLTSKLYTCALIQNYQDNAGKGQLE